MSIVALDIDLPDLSDAVASDEALISNEERKMRTRWGRITASQMSRLMTVEKTPSQLPKGALTYLSEITAEKLTRFDHVDGYKSRAMERGLELEVEAAERYIAETGNKLTNYGADQKVITFDTLLSCTPDGLVDDWGGIDTKCLDSKNHLIALSISSALELRDKFTEYYWQALACAIITLRSSWDVVFYDPRFKAHHHQIKIINVNVEACESDVSFMWRRIGLAEQYLAKLSGDLS